MLVLRLAHARARSAPSFVEPDPRAEMADLADDFPGALREIDELPLEVIVARIERLSTADAEPSNAEPWMIAQVAFHRLARGALVAKRWLGRRKDVTPEDEEAFARALPSLRHRSDAELFSGDLARIGRPPRGRLMDLVHARLAAVLAVTETEARALVFGPPRPRSRRP